MDGPVSDLTSTEAHVKHVTELMRAIGHANQRDFDMMLLSGYNHRARNALNGIVISMHLCFRKSPGPQPACWSGLELLYQQTMFIFDALQWWWRHISNSYITSSLNEFIEHQEAKWMPLLAAHGRRIITEPPAKPVLGQFNLELLGTIFDHIVLWRFKNGTCDIRIQWYDDDDSVTVVFSEPWPSDAVSEESEAITQPGSTPEWVFPDLSRLAELVILPMLARLVASQGGQIYEWTQHRWSLGVRWPHAAPHPERIT
jgi:hypothetical protein